MKKSNKFSPEVRVRTEKRDPKKILEEDAKDSIDLMYNFFQAIRRSGA